MAPRHRRHFKLFSSYWLSSVWSRYWLYSALPSYVLGSLSPELLMNFFISLLLESVPSEDIDKLRRLVSMVLLGSFHSWRLLWQIWLTRGLNNSTAISLWTPDAAGLGSEYCRRVSFRGWGSFLGLQIPPLAVLTWLYASLLSLHAFSPSIPLRVGCHSDCCSWLSLLRLLGFGGFVFFVFVLFILFCSFVCFALEINSWKKQLKGEEFTLAHGLRGYSLPTWLLRYNTIGWLGWLMVFIVRRAGL